MNCKYLYIAAATMALIATGGCKNGEKNELDHDHAHEHAEALEHGEEKGHEHGSGEIVVEPEMAEKFGIKTERVTLQDFSGELILTGQLLTPASEEAVVSATTNGVLTMNSSVVVGSRVSSGQQLGKISGRSATGDDPNAQAKASIAAAKREVERLKPLLDDGIVTKGEYNAALSALETAKASFSNASASGVVKSPVSGTVTQILANTGQFVETGTPLARITRNEMLVLRVDFPESEAQRISGIKGAEIRNGATGDWIQLASLQGKKLESSEFPVQSGYLPLFYSFRNNGKFTSGSFVEVGLQCSECEAQIVIPESAVVEQQGEKYVYVKKGDHGYEKRRITVAGRSGNNLAVSSGLTDGEEIVTEGAMVVKMAESSGVVPEGHSHNH